MTPEKATGLILAGIRVVEAAVKAMDSQSAALKSDPCSNYSYCRCLDWLRDAKAALREQEAKP